MLSHLEVKVSPGRLGRLDEGLDLAEFSRFEFKFAACSILPR